MAKGTNLSSLGKVLSACVAAIAMGSSAVTVKCSGETPATQSGHVYKVTDFGAAGDGKTNSTAAIQSAIKACSTGGGGEVDVPAGTYFCTPLELLSNVDLHLENGAVLLFSPNMADYPIGHVDEGTGDQAGCLSPFWAIDQKNIAITGEGTIDGQGAGWRQTKQNKLSAEDWDKLVKSGGVLDRTRTTWYPDLMSRDGHQELSQVQAQYGTTSFAPYEKFRSLMRPKLIRLTSCQGIHLEGVTFRQSAMWNIHLCLSDDITIKNITVYNPASAQNGDGIDIDSCRNVKLSDSTFNAGDDGICIKSGMDAAGRKRGRPTENVTITHCTVGTGHGGVVIGSEMSGGVRNINVSDCIFNGTDNGLRFKSVRGRGGVVENVTVNHIQMSNIGGVAILFDLYYMTKHSQTNAPVPVSEATPIFRNFSVHDVTCNGAHIAMQWRGLPEMPLEGMTLTDVDIKADLAGEILNARDITLQNVHIHGKDGQDVKVEDVQNLKVEGCSGIGKP